MCDMGHVCEMCDMCGEMCDKRDMVSTEADQPREARESGHVRGDV